MDTFRVTRGSGWYSDGMVISTHDTPAAAMDAARRYVSPECRAVCGGAAVWTVTVWDMTPLSWCDGRALKVIRATR